MDDPHARHDAKDALAHATADEERRIYTIAGAIQPVLQGLTPELLAGVQVEVLLAGYRAVLQLEGDNLVVDVYVTRQKRTDA
jgi:hypothetical protein